MRRTWIHVAMIEAVAVAAAGEVSAGESATLRWMIWFQPAFGLATGDDKVTGEVPTDVSVTGIPLIGSVGTTLPATCEVEFEDPVGVLFGGEVVFRRIGIEVNGIYVSKAAVGRGGLKVRGGLLSEQECDVLEALGISVTDVIVAEEDIKNFAVTLGVNYHFVDGKSWDIWAGPMVVWSAWGQYDLSDARIELSASLEDLLQGTVDQFDLSSNPSIAPENALTFGASVGGRYEFADGWSAVGSVRYFNGDEVELPGGSGRYGMVSFSVGIARSFGH